MTRRKNERGRPVRPPPRIALWLLATELIESHLEEREVGELVDLEETRGRARALRPEELGGVLEVLLRQAAVDREHLELHVALGRRADGLRVEGVTDVLLGDLLQVLRVAVDLAELLQQRLDEGQDRARV